MSNFLLAIIIVCSISGLVLLLMVFSYYIQEWTEEKAVRKLESEWHLKTLD